jgi:hypothetical protein
VAGCGGSSEKRFVRRADAVCSAYNAATRPVPRPRSYTEIVRFVRTVLPLHADALRRLSALDPPTSQAGAVRSWLAVGREAEEALRRLGGAADRREYDAVVAATARLQSSSRRSRRLARALGLAACAIGR